jgi:hypothetical protein
MLIHDSFGVPANSVENLTLAVRQSFIELFEADPLFDWVNQITPEIVESTGDIMLNTLDLGEVLQSTYIFS